MQISTVIVVIFVFGNFVVMQELFAKKVTTSQEVASPLRVKAPYKDDLGPYLILWYDREARRLREVI